MKNSAQKMKAGDVSLGLCHHFIGAFGRAGGTPEMLQLAADDRTLMQEFFGLFQPTVLATAIAATFLTGEYFTTRSGLWVFDDFRSRITSAYPEGLVPQGLGGGQSFNHKSNSYNRDIIGRMNGEGEVRKHAFTPDQVAGLIDLQKNGESGRLLANGYSNLFYMVGENAVLFVVRVGWHPDNREWIVNAWELDVRGRWRAGFRVFRNTRVLEA